MAEYRGSNVHACYFRHDTFSRIKRFTKKKKKKKKKKIIIIIINSMTDIQSKWTA
jgi:hypothetical protein